MALNDKIKDEFRRLSILLGDSDFGLKKPDFRVISLGLRSASLGVLCDLGEIFRPDAMLAKGH